MTLVMSHLPHRVTVYMLLCPGAAGVTVCACRGAGCGAVRCGAVRCGGVWCGGVVRVTRTRPGS